jgi:hypothetical protein
MSGDGVSGRRAGLPRLVVAAVALSAAACAEVPEETAAVHEPAVVEDVGGDGTVVRFEAVAAEQVDLRTAPVRSARGRSAVPYAALIYDPAGTVWVYTVEEPLTYSRHEVVVDRVRGRTVWLRKGPEPGTRVVTRGAAEVYGTELGISGGH